MKKGYYVLQSHQWGYAESLHEAMQNCHLNAPTRFSNSIATIEEFHDNEVDLKDGLEEIARYPEDQMDEGIERFQIIISDADNWKLSRTDDIDGSPSYEWIGEGDRPDGYVPTTSIVGDLNLATGEITIEKHQLPKKI